MPQGNYKVGDIVDLDDVAISPAAFAHWQAAAALGAQALARLYPGMPLDIPDEQGLWLASGELEIFVEVRGVRISQKIPAGEWQWA
jgi:hypothetical protein